MFTAHEYPLWTEQLEISECKVAADSNLMADLRVSI